MAYGFDARPPHQQSDYRRAGAGLNTSQARQRFGGKAHVGAAGERKFAELMRGAGLDAKYSIFYSLNLPSAGPGGGRQYQSDVDVALINGNRIVLVDVKNWKPNVVYWSLGSIPMCNLSPLLRDGRMKHSANMAAAVSRYRQAFPHAKVSAMVVFIPSAKGEMPISVRWLKWPGGIRSYSLTAAFKEIEARLGSTPLPPDMRLIGGVRALER